MSTQMQTLSARVPADDVAWLSSLEVAGAATPSDKLRTLITQMRRQHEGVLDHASSLTWLRDLLSPSVAAMKALEHREQTHSAAVSAVMEWLPQIVATALSARGIRSDDAASAAALERALIQQCFQLLTALLRLGIMPRAECYTEDVIEKQLPRVLELLQLITTTRANQETPK